MSSTTIHTMFGFLPVLVRSAASRAATEVSCSAWGTAGSMLAAVRTALLSTDAGAQPAAGADVGTDAGAAGCPGVCANVVPATSAVLMMDTKDIDCKQYICEGS